MQKNDETLVNKKQKASYWPVRRWGNPVGPRWNLKQMGSQNLSAEVEGRSGVLHLSLEAESLWPWE